ncbi:LOW QUALITY PROTEIN: hypothetical protein PHMEG_00018602 [Phytophthora megakarya]|uniref:Uncharacterized protein n=1 Tax=Phytophthora megakarya TaxID=4795 RepID=A0A225VV74_9STRA|nr:LOW QUALITY PROTEIN: hypothetical protein PHMEG_00018602 [Phytophthora megakarya]
MIYGTYSASVAMHVVQQLGNLVDHIARFEGALIMYLRVASPFMNTQENQRGNWLDKKFVSLGFTATAIAQFMGSANIGARPFCLMPREVNMTVHIRLDFG